MQDLRRSNYLNSTNKPFKNSGFSLEQTNKNQSSTQSVNTSDKELSAVPLSPDQNKSIIPLLPKVSNICLQLVPIINKAFEASNFILLERNKYYWICLSNKDKKSKSDFQQGAAKHATDSTHYEPRKKTKCKPVVFATSNPNSSRKVNLEDQSVKQQS